MARISRMLALFAVLSLLGSGCSGGGSPVKKVKGVVLLDGEPLGGAMVHFRPQEKKDDNASAFVAKTDPNGSFEVKPGPHVTIVPGRYAVIITKAPGEGTEDVAMPPGGIPGIASEVPPKYSDVDRPQFNRDIAAGDNDLAPFELASEKKKKGRK